jgi:hypothetical protein
VQAEHRTTSVCDACSFRQAVVGLHFYRHQRRYAPRQILGRRWILCHRACSLIGHSFVLRRLVFMTVHISTDQSRSTHSPVQQVQGRITISGTMLFMSNLFGVCTRVECPRTGLTSSKLHLIEAVTKTERKLSELRQKTRQQTSDARENIGR